MESDGKKPPRLMPSVSVIIMNDWTYNFRKACDSIARHDPNRSFADFVDENETILSELVILYSTNNIKFLINGFSFQEIERKFAKIKWLFCGSGLEFYSKQLWKITHEKGEVALPLSIQLSFDSNVSEDIRKFTLGKEISHQEILLSVINFIKEQPVNFDFSFFVLENLIHSLTPENSRPLATIASLKKLDSLDYDAFLHNHSEPKFGMSTEEAFSQAEIVLENFHNNDAINHELTKQRATYAIYLMAICLYFDEKITPQEKMSKLYEFCIKKMKKILKLELYICWKFFVNGSKIKFFAPILSKGKNILKISKGMSWDIFVFRHQLIQIYKSKFGEFIIPMFCTFDEKFLSLLEACPLRACLINPTHQRCELIFADEFEFQVFLNDSISSLSSEGNGILRGSKSRIENKLNKDDIDHVIKDLEEKIVSHIS